MVVMLRRPLRSFFHYKVTIGAAETETAYSGNSPARFPGPPIHPLSCDKEGAAFEIDVGVGAFKMQGWRQIRVFERKQHFDQSSDARGQRGVADIGFHRPNRTVA